MDRRTFIVGAGVAGAGHLLRSTARAVSFIRFPYLQNVTADTATIIWATFEPGSGSARIVSESQDIEVPARVRVLLPAETHLTVPMYQFQVDASGLTAGSSYSYSIYLDGDEITPPGRAAFRTPGDGPFRFLAFGDSGQATPAQLQLANRMASEDADLAIHVGDIAYQSATFDDFHFKHFNYYFRLLQQVPFFPVAGNHEYETSNAAPFLTLHSPPVRSVPSADRGRYYSFDWSNVHFVALDSNLPLLRSVDGTGAMLRWLENDLRLTRKFWKVAYFHHPPYAAGPNERDPLSILTRERLVPILERAGVQLVLSGHEHSYQRTVPLRGGRQVNASAGCVYVTTGGGGAALYPVFRSNLMEAGQSAHHYLRASVDGGRLTVEAVGTDGALVDQFAMAPPPTLLGATSAQAFTLLPDLRVGALLRIQGRDLSAEEQSICTLPLPTELGGTVVTINGRPLELFYVSADQIFAQIPFAVQGNAMVRVRTSNGEVERGLVP